MNIDKERFNWTLNQKIDHSLGAIEQFYNAMNGNIYVSFSGGKDSTVLLHLVRMLYPETKAVFINTGLEFPEIQKFVKTIDNVDIIRPKMSFREVIQKYGYPYPSKEVAQKIYEATNTRSDKLKNKRLFGDDKGNGKISEKWKHLIDAPFNISYQCCNKLKKAPVKSFEKATGLHPILGTMASESGLRKTEYLKNWCNILDGKRPIGRPLSIWNDSDIWEYIKKYNIQYSDIYNKGYERTGCMFCLFGISQEKSDIFNKNRLQKLKETHPKQYQYIIDELNFKDILDYEHINY